VAEQALSTAVVADQKAQSASGGLSGAWLPRLITGFVILLSWEIVVRAFAPAYVAKPTGVILAIPKVLTEPAFLQALGSTLVAVAEGLAITIVIGWIIHDDTTRAYLAAHSGLRYSGAAVVLMTAVSYTWLSSTIMTILRRLDSQLRELDHFPPTYYEFRRLSPFLGILLMSFVDAPCLLVILYLLFPAA